MRKFMIATAAAGMLLAATSLASAATITASITHIDVNARIIVINGRAYHVPTTIKIGAFKVGDKVTVVYEIDDRQLRIVSIKVD